MTRSYKFVIAALCGSIAPVTLFAADVEGGEAVEAVVVTGSLIRANEFDAPTPTISMSSAAIATSGATNVTDLLRTQPALIGSLDTTQTTNLGIGTTGLNLLDLRNLGTERTLVLVDGRRHVAQVPESASVDINTIPADLIERIDIVTGGVSAVYGADAVSGVVNFVMKKDFEGLVGRVQYGSAEDGEPTDMQAAITGGFNFADGRGNLSGSIEHTSEGRIRASDRSYLRGENYARLVRNTDDPHDDPNVPDYVPVKNIRFYDSSREGALDTDFDYEPDLRPDGSPYMVDRFIAPYFTEGGTGTLMSDYIGDIRAKTETTIGNVFLNYELSSAAKLFAEAKFARGTANAYGEPTFDYYLEFSPENPFITPAVSALAPEGFQVSRDNFDLGVRGEDLTRETFRSVAGINGDVFGGDYHYEASYVYGQSDVRSIAINNRYNDRFLAAIDVMTDPLSGQPTCRSNLDPGILGGDLSFEPGPASGCLPLNILGEGVADPAAIDWVMLNSRETSRITQNVFNTYISGPIPGVTLPAGDIDAVAGFEWRRETSRSNPPLEDQLGFTFGNVRKPVDGKFDVKEAFLELRAPILKDLPFAELLQVSGALRQSDYSTVGSTTTWNAGVLWAPVSDLSFRGTVSESVRAPNISELFAPENQTFEFIDDPCDSTRINNGTQYRTANCTAVLSALGFDPTDFSDPNASNIPGLSQGNTQLSEETSRSYTFGTVLRPRFAPGLAIAVDYYDIDIRQAISTAEAQDVANNCVDQPTLENIFCDALTRDPVTGGIDSFLVQPENVGSYRTRGVDFNIGYALNPVDLGIAADIGTFRLTLVGNRLERLTIIPTPGAQQINRRTTQYAPKRQVTFDATWYFHALTLNYGYNYFSKTNRYDLLEVAGDPDIASPENIYFDALKQHDLYASVDFRENYQLFLGVKNLTDQKPDYSTNYPISPVGRFIYGGFKLNFGGPR
jgi:outer membrane receptor protein involved in Fe transport